MTRIIGRGRLQSAAKAPPDFSSVQADLFQRLEVPATEAAGQAEDLDLGPELVGAINSALRHARNDLRMKREAVVAAMNKLLPDAKPITVRQLNCWTATSKEFHEFPARYLAAFCVATDCEEPLRVLARALSFDLVDARERMAKELGQTFIQSAQLKRRQRELRQKLGG